MLPNIVLFMLAAFPVLYFLPLNFIRFRWGQRNGVAPMPPEVRAGAEAGDRAELLVVHLVLLVLVAFSMRGSPVSLQEIGISLDNWKQALGMGLLFSLPLVGLSELAISKVPPEIARKEAKSRGPVTAWFGLILSGSFSTEIWRAFCIAVLARNGFSAWLAIVLAALFSATVSLQVSIAKTVGAAAIGGMAGFLFVDTGSLLAPMSMGVIAGVAHLYYLRRACSNVRPRWSDLCRPCPVCGETIRLSKVRWAGDMLACPKCGESLTTRKKHLWAIGALSMAAAVYPIRRLIYRSLDYALLAEGIAFALFFVLTILSYRVVPPKLKRVKGKAFGKELSLFGTDEDDGNLKHTRK